mmetsp:Transcript_73386/g.226590  ORF Transcript_73386/g.226590 Transcript_73386/m.226590 type:complete len:312 (+) Transcript_73386:193-1128(+)
MSNCALPHWLLRSVQAHSAPRALRHPARRSAEITVDQNAEPPGRDAQPPTWWMPPCLSMPPTLAGRWTIAVSSAWPKPSKYRASTRETRMSPPATQPARTRPSKSSTGSGASLSTAQHPVPVSMPHPSKATSSWRLRASALPRPPSMQPAASASGSAARQRRQARLARASSGSSSRLRMLTSKGGPAAAVPLPSGCRPPSAAQSAARAASRPNNGAAAGSTTASGPSSQPQLHSALRQSVSEPGARTLATARLSLRIFLYFSSRGLARTFSTMRRRRLPTAPNASTDSSQAPGPCARSRAHAASATSAIGG